MGCAANFGEYNYCKEAIQSMIPQFRSKYSCGECDQDKCNERVLEFTTWNFKMSNAESLHTIKSLIILEIMINLILNIAS